MTPIGSFEFTAPLWLHPGSGGWHFVTLPGEVAEDISDLTVGLRRGFGSVRVAVTVGSSSWRTSIFPDASRGSYVLPVKKPVRAAEHLVAGDDIAVRIDLLDL
jgi:hypothetical protein